MEVTLGARGLGRVVIESGLEEGDRVRCASPWGEVEARVTFDDELMPGVVAMTHGWGNAKTPGMQVASRHPGVNSNLLAPDVRYPRTGNALYVFKLRDE